MFPLQIFSATSPFVKKEKARGATDKSEADGQKGCAKTYQVSNGFRPTGSERELLSDYSLPWLPCSCILGLVLGRDS